MQPSRSYLLSSLYSNGLRCSQLPQSSPDRDNTRCCVSHNCGRLLCARPSLTHKVMLGVGRGLPAVVLQVEHSHWGGLGETFEAGAPVGIEGGALNAAGPSLGGLAHAWIDMHSEALQRRFIFYFLFLFLIVFRSYHYVIHHVSSRWSGTFDVVPYIKWALFASGTFDVGKALRNAKNATNASN